MLERLIKRELEAQLDRVDNSDLSTFFGNQQRFTDAEVDLVQRTFQAQKPTVVIGYPRRDTAFPAYSVQLSNEREYQPGTYLGDYGGLISSEQAEILGDSTLVDHEHLSAMFLREYSIFTYSIHPDVALYMYEIAKRAMFLARKTFNNEGVLRTTFFGGDLDPIQSQIFAQQSGDWLFRRQLRIQAVEMFEVIEDTPSDLVREVQGLHVFGGSTRPPTDVRAYTTVYNTEGGDQ